MDLFPEGRKGPRLTLFDPLRDLKVGKFVRKRTLKGFNIASRGSLDPTGDIVRKLENRKSERFEG